MPKFCNVKLLYAYLRIQVRRGENCHNFITIIQRFKNLALPTFSDINFVTIKENAYIRLTSFQLFNHIIHSLIVFMRITYKSMIRVFFSSNAG